MNGLGSGIGLAGLLTNPLGVGFRRTPFPALTVTGGNFTLINQGHSALAVTDPTGAAVTGCTVLSSDATKIAVYSGQTVVGKANSGSAVLTVGKSGYTPTTITVTCSAIEAQWISTAGTNTTTNGQPVTSWTDQIGGVVLAEPTNAPLYTTNALNGIAGLTFDGTNARLNTAAPVPAVNGAALSVFYVLRPALAGDGRAQSRQITNSINTGAFLGWNISMDLTNKIFISVGSGLVFGTPAPTTTNGFSGGAARYVVLQIATGAQLIRVGGVTEATGTYAYTPQSTNVCRLATNTGDTGNRFPGDYYQIITGTRTWTSTEYGQLELMARNLYAL